MYVNALARVGRGRWLLILPVFLLLFASTAFADTSSACPFAWERNLKVGSTGVDVLALQRFLNSSPETRIAETSAGSPGNESNVFGPRTKTSVIKFQEKFASEILTPAGLFKGTGIVGIRTRAKLNALCVAPAVSQTNLPMTQVASAISAQALSSSSVSTESAALVVSSAEQPVSTIAPQQAYYVPFTSFEISARGADLTVNSITVQRTGPSSDKVFDYLSLVDGDDNELSYAYIRSDHTAVFKFKKPLEVRVGEPLALSVDGNMAWDLSEHSGEVAILQVRTIDASVPVEGQLPIRGASQSINSSLQIGTASAVLSQYDPNNAMTRYVNDTAVRFSGIRITAGSTEDLRLYSLTWRQSGTASNSDISNVKVVVDEQSYQTEADGRDYTASFPEGVLIRKGNSVDAYIQGDIGITGSNRTIQFDIDDATYIYLVGQNYGYGIYTLPGGNTDVSGNSVFLTEDGTTDTDSIKPFFSGSVTTISGGAETLIGKN
ncbi:MAG: peptidoglycan-binding domain-containing protein [bacterium]|nr:peptidoglycan-binding domain-containing protein [bacterium]